MVDFISTLGLQQINSANLSSGQGLLSQLSQQLATGKYSSSLTDYSSSQAQKVLNFNSQISQQNGFTDVIKTLTPRMDLYNASFEGIEDTIGTATNALLGATVYDSTRNASLQTQIQGYMDQVSYYLNQQVGGRYVFAGSRYDQVPVGDIKTLATPPTETSPYLATNPAVPAYDTDYNAADPTAAQPAAYDRASASIDVAQTVTYGVTSNDKGFQQVIMGLRWAYAATQDPTNYTDYMNTARDLLNQGIANVRAAHTDSTNVYSAINTTKTSITDKISYLTTQVDDVENVDINDVAVKVTTLQSQLEASYSVTAKMAKLSILNYL